MNELLNADDRISYQMLTIKCNSVVSIRILLSETVVIVQYFFKGLIGSEWEVMGVASNIKLTASERVREKMLLKSGTDTQGLQLSSTLDSEVTPYALYRLEREGVQVRREISSKNTDFQAVLRQKQPDANSAMVRWISSVHQTSLKPTWRTLLLVLRLINLDHLAEQINTYLSGGTVKQLPEGTSASKEQEKSLSEVFTFAALTQLEKREGIPVLTELEARNHEFQAMISLKQPQPNLSWAIDRWLTTPLLSHIKPTWKNFLCVLRLINLDQLAKDIEIYLKGRVKKLRDELFALCDKLKESDDDENVHHLKKIEVLSKSAIEQIKEKTEIKETPFSVMDIEKHDLLCLPSPAPPQPKKTMVVKSEPSSSYLEKFDTSIQGTDTNAPTTTRPFVKKEPPEGDMISTTGPTDSTELDTLREEIQQLRDENQELRDQLVLVQLPEGIMETQPVLAQLTGFRGVEVCGETTVVVTNDPQSFAWEGYGLKIHIPQGCLPAGMEQCTINIKASLAGQYEFPENTHLVSAVFWLRCEPRRCKFTVPVSLEIQHCARPENISKLSFVKALCSQESLPYIFRRQQGGRFTSSSSYGVLELESFSGAGVTQEGSEDREYIARLFYQIQTIRSYEIHLVVTWNIEAYLTAVELKYSQSLPGPDQPVDFESDQIELDIPEDGITLQGGWVLTPLTTVVTKKHVDNYHPGKRIPNCQLSADLEDDSTEVKVVPFRYRIKLLGAKKPHNKFTIKPPASSVKHGVAQYSSSSSVSLTTKRSLSPPPTAASSLKKIRTTEPHQLYSDASYWLQSQALGGEDSSVQDSTHYQPVPGPTSIYGYLIPPPSQPGGLQALPMSSQGTQPLAQHTYYSSQQPLVHHTPYIHGNQAPPLPTQQASRLPWQPTMHQPANTSGLQTSTLVTLSTPFQQGGGDMTSHKTITIKDVANQAGVSLDTLSDECSQTVLLDLAKYCDKWKLIGQCLGLTEAEISDVDGDNQTAQEKRVGMLMKWKETSLTTSYHVLIEALLSQGMTQAAVEACRVIGAASSRH